MGGGSCDVLDGGIDVDQGRMCSPDPGAEPASPPRLCGSGVGSGAWKKGCKMCLRV